MQLDIDYTHQNVKETKLQESFWSKKMMTNRNRWGGRKDCSLKQKLQKGNDNNSDKSEY